MGRAVRTAVVTVCGYFLVCRRDSGFVQVGLPDKYRQRASLYRTRPSATNGDKRSGGCRRTGNSYRGLAGKRIGRLD